MKNALLVTFLVFISNFVYASEARENLKLSLIGKTLSDKEVQKQLTFDNYNLCSLHFEEADDDGTEPLYIITMCKFDYQTGASLNKCFYLEFDTDTPSKSPSVNLAECL